ncbi:MAG: phosphoglycerate dehydrogenase [Dehalococcoidales bacterium]|nr:phosphoglycerate dehydrogenase [Dehalococcoidales bacterium]
MKILVADSISNEGIEALRGSGQVDVKTGLKPEELIAIIGDYDALVVRSQTQVTAKVIEAGKKLQVIGRAGVGVDNIDVEAATRHGIIVANAPTGNTISAAEHTIALMLALARHIPQASASLKAGAWRRNEFMGTEVRNKTLGVIGLGNVGSGVARRARGLEMRVIACDPAVSLEYARNLQVEIVPLGQLLKESDFISLHLPLTASTRGLIGVKELALMKPKVRIINTARGGLIDEEALVKAIDEKRVAGAAIDVFATEPITKSILFEKDNIIVTPHLGASTAEAQAMATKDVVDQIIDVFKGQPARYAVNAPFVSAEALTLLGPYIKASAMAGKLSSQLAEGQMSTIHIKYEGEISSYNTNVLKAAALGGLLEEISEERVNLVNANILASQRGLTVVEHKDATCKNYASLVTVEVGTSSGVTTIAATVMRDEPHIVRVNNYWIDIAPTGAYFLVSEHHDRPGLIGAVGKIAGDANINISYMHVSRLKPRGRALMVLALDEPLPEAQRREILAVPDVYSVKLVKL